MIRNLILSTLWMMSVAVGMAQTTGTVRFDATKTHQKITGFGAFVCSPQFQYNHMSTAEINKVWGKTSTIGCNIMDNLIADGKIKPFIVVMAYGLTNDFKFGSIGQFTAKEFETLLIDELMPVIDKQFLTKPDKWNRALAGLSMGGMETKLITLRRPEVFGYWGLLSGGQYAPDEIKDPKVVKYIFEGCGDKENPDGINKSVEALKAAGFNAEGLISEGTAHEFLT